MITKARVGTRASHCVLLLKLDLGSSFCCGLDWTQPSLNLHCCPCSCPAGSALKASAPSGWGWGAYSYPASFRLVFLSSLPLLSPPCPLGPGPCPYPCLQHSQQLYRHIYLSCKEETNIQKHYEALYSLLALVSIELANEEVVVDLIRLVLAVQVWAGHKVGTGREDQALRRVLSRNCFPIVLEPRSIAPLVGHSSMKATNCGPIRGTTEECLILRPKETQGTGSFKNTP